MCQTDSALRWCGIIDPGSMELNRLSRSGASFPEPVDEQWAARPYHQETPEVAIHPRRGDRRLEARCILKLTRCALLGLVPATSRVPNNRHGSPFGVRGRSPRADGMDWVARSNALDSIKRSVVSKRLMQPIFCNIK